MAQYEVTNAYRCHWERGEYALMSTQKWSLGKLRYYIMVPKRDYKHPAKQKESQPTSVILLSQMELSPDKAVILDQATSSLHPLVYIFERYL